MNRMKSWWKSWSFCWRLPGYSSVCLSLNKSVCFTVDLPFCPCVLPCWVYVTRRCPSLAASDSNWVRRWRNPLPVPPCQCVCEPVHLPSRCTVKMDAQMKCPPPAVVQQMKGPQHWQQKRMCVCVCACVYRPGGLARGGHFSVSGKLI